ncbi:MAG: hypothetical protein K6T78_07310 [Alicyclobacillus sp.]|nr:hypothetical protein [Alicyclobacillus sp.]
MPTFGGEHLSVAKALVQLECYLNMLDIPVTVRELYERAYRHRRGEHYDDRWLNHLRENPEVAGALDEPFTSDSIVETLMRTGHEPIVRAVMKEVRHRDIQFHQVYMIGTPRRY